MCKTWTNISKKNLTFIVHALTLCQVLGSACCIYYLIEIQEVGTIIPISEMNTEAQSLETAILQDC